MQKLTRKHRTFDCDLDVDVDRPQQQRQTLAQQANTNQSQENSSHKPTELTGRNVAENNHLLRHTNRSNTDDHDDDDDNQSHRLSKLVLSSSLHQLADSKYHTNSNVNNTDFSTTANHPERTAQPDDEHAFGPPPQQNAQMQNSSQTTNQNRNNEFKNSAKQNQNSKRDANLDTVHVVVGNESCDLDSAVSCLLMFHIISKMSDEINGKDKSRTLYIPLLNTTRDLLETKCEVLWFLQKTLNIDKSFLTCKDDIDWTEIKRNGVEVLVTLVDHNYNDEFKDIGKIVEIIDHHQVQNADWLADNHAGIRLTLDTSVGSCTTLVAERLFYIYAEHHVSDEILLLIYGTVLLDTICLSEKAKRFTRRDVYLLKKLDHLLGSRRPIRDELYRQLVEVKNSTRELDFEKLMKRDLKVYKDKRGMRVGIASLFGMAAKEALGLAANIDVDQFFRQNAYEAFIIMGLIADLEHSDSISRDLVLISANNHLFAQLCAAFESDTSKLDLVPISSSDSSPDPEDNLINSRQIVSSSSSNTTADVPSSSSSPVYRARIWLQRNVTSSRKVVAPLVLKVLHDGAQ